jgi:hypothetical protein
LVLWLAISKRFSTVTAVIGTTIAIIVIVVIVVIVVITVQVAAITDIAVSAGVIGDTVTDVVAAAVVEPGVTAVIVDTVATAVVVVTVDVTVTVAVAIAGSVAVPVIVVIAIAGVVVHLYQGCLDEKRSLISREEVDLGSDVNFK